MMSKQTWRLLKQSSHLVRAPSYVWKDGYPWILPTTTSKMISLQLSRSRMTTCVPCSWLKGFRHGQPLLLPSYSHASSNSRRKSMPCVVTSRTGTSTLQVARMLSAFIRTSWRSRRCQHRSRSPCEVPQRPRLDHGHRKYHNMYVISQRYLQERSLLGAGKRRSQKQEIHQAHRPHHQDMGVKRSSVHLPEPYPLCRQHMRYNSPR